MHEYHMRSRTSRLIISTRDMMPWRWNSNELEIVDRFECDVQQLEGDEAPFQLLYVSLEPFRDFKIIIIPSPKKAERSHIDRANIGTG